MAVKIKLMRLGKKRHPQYRIVIADSRTARDGRSIEEIGKYHPKEEPSLIEVDSERAQYWLSVGAQPTEPVLAILKVTGDWQTFKGLPGGEGTLRVAEAKTDKRTVFEAAAKAGDELPAATTPKKKAAKDAADVEAAVEAEPTAEAVVEAEPAVESAVEAEPTAEAVVEAEPAVESVVEAEPAAEPQAAPETEA